MLIFVYLIIGIILVYLFKYLIKFKKNDCLNHKNKYDCMNNKNCVFCKKKKTCLNINQYNNSIEMCNNIKNFYNKNKSYKKEILKGIMSRENCKYICNDNKLCLKFEQDLKNFNDCEKCHKEGKCFRILDTNTGICEKCIDGENNQYKCNNTRFLGCPNNKNLNSFDGVKPYFVILKSEDINDIYGSKCNLCK